MKNHGRLVALLAGVLLACLASPVVAETTPDNVKSCSATAAKLGAWKPTSKEVDALVRMSHGGMCGTKDFIELPITLMADAVQACVVKAGSTTFSMVVEQKSCAKSSDYPTCSCTLAVASAEASGRKFLRLYSTPVADQQIDVFELVGEQLVPYYHGFPYVEAPCSTGAKKGAGATAKMLAEWGNLPEQLKKFVCDQDEGP